MSPLRRVKTKIGELLLQRGLITSEQLHQALALQRTKQKDKQLGQILIESGYVKREDFYIILAVQSGYPYISVNQCTIRPEVLSLLPAVMAKKYQVLPIDKFQDILTVAMTNPSDIVALDEIKKLTESQVKVFLTTPLELEEMLKRSYA